MYMISVGKERIMLFTPLSFTNKWNEYWQMTKKSWHPWFVCFKILYAAKQKSLMTMSRMRFVHDFLAGKLIDDAEYWR
jgi:hypothetical protein